MSANIFAESVIYAISDYVDNPSFQPYSQNTVSGRLNLVARAGDRSDNSVILKLKKPIVQIDTGNYINIRLPRLNIKVSDANNRCSAILRKPIVQSHIDNSPKPKMNYVNAYIPRPIIALPFIKNGGIAKANLKLGKLRAFATDLDNYAIAQLTIKGLKASIKSTPFNNKVEINEFLVVKSDATYYAPNIIVFSESLYLHGHLDLFFITSIDLFEQLSINDNFELKSLLRIFIEDSLKIVSSNTFSDKEFNQYSVNLESFALSLYKGFNFIGFTRVNGDTYGIKKDGLYKIQAGPDDGSQFDCEIDLGARDWGAPNIKKVSSAYVGIRTDGQLYLRVEVDKEHFNIYSFDDRPDEQRTFMSKGAGGKYWRMKLILEEPSYASVDSVEFEVNLSNRRLRG